MLSIYAGDHALKTIREQGFTQDLFTTQLGASGGPKWFVLKGLDQFLVGQFYKGRTQPLNVVGSSIGSYRAACYAQLHPVEAIQIMADKYIETTYEKRRVSRTDITDSSRLMLQAMFGVGGISEIVNNRVFKAHFIAAKINGWGASENRLLQVLGMAKAGCKNLYKRRLMVSQFERVVFQQNDSQFIIDDPDGFTTHRVALSEDNVNDAILASGALPLAMHGVHNIAGAPLGVYRDGGVIDYHFDFNVGNEGLVLYPHFSSTIRAGWFDKSSSRKVRAASYDRVVLLCPSAEFIAALRYEKIPDRHDFKRFSDRERIAYWRAVTVESERLAESFGELLNRQNVSDIKPISSLVGA